jgi:hypothetical protein
VLNYINYKIKKIMMKTMTCKKLGGACDQAFTAGSFEEIAEQSKKHGIEMFQKLDEKHLEAMNRMTELMQTPAAMQEWFDDKKKQFDSLPEDGEM